MKIVALSDTHGCYENLSVPDGDVLVHTGDACFNGTNRYQFENFMKWMSNQNFRHKIYVPGNHDGVIEHDIDTARKQFKKYGISLLVDEKIEIDGKTFYGSPWTPTFLDWYFMKDRGEDIEKVWNLVPDNIDVLLTHGPPYGVLDRVLEGSHQGCEQLLNKVNEVKPKLHIFGHIHEGRGFVEKNGIHFYNVSVIDRYLDKIYPVVEIEI